ncbi:MAG: penicillin-binding protein 2 [Ignavibacteria bacterium]|nr:penicillin-binding protein 2 [Ignavibacteria bacterium]
MKNSSGDGEFASLTRQRIFRYAVLAISIIYIGRLGWLQIIQGNDYRLKAESQAIKQIKVEPFRGMMIDRNGRAIVQNYPGFSVTVTPYEFTNESALRLSKILGVSDSVIWVEVRRAAAYNKFNPAKIPAGRDVSFEVVSLIEELRDELPGVDVIIDPKRLYAFDGHASHLLGYTSEVNESQLGRLGDSYDPGDITGKTGLENAYEAFIRGQKGLHYVAVNKNGQMVSSFNDGKSDLAALEGFDLYLGLDTDLQVLAEKLMNPYKGAVIALDPSTGEILAYVSKPDFDLKLFSGRISRADYKAVSTAPGIPLFNRVSTAAYPPGSTWKPLMALMALQEGVITEKTKLVCNGGFQFGNRFAKCHGGTHGAIDLYTAISKSCNAFFYQLGVKMGVDRFTYYGTLFGFGQRTRGDIIEESAGILPSRTVMDRLYGKGKWTNYALMNWGIGQGEVNVTPLQMSAYISTIANEGTWCQPHAVRAMYNKVLKKMQPISYERREIPIDKDHFRVVKKAMRQVVTDGTARFINMPDIEVCGKTGTAERGGGAKDQSWFVCFAPMHNPKIALVVTAEGGGFGATTAGPIARKLLELFFHNQWPEEFRRDSKSIQQQSDSSDATVNESSDSPFLKPLKKRPSTPKPQVPAVLSVK